MLCGLTEPQPHQPGAWARGGSERSGPRSRPDTQAGQSGTRTRVLCLSGQGSLPGCRPLGCLRFFLSQTSFFQLFLPHGLRVEEPTCTMSNPQDAPAIPSETPSLQHLQPQQHFPPREQSPSSQDRLSVVSPPAPSSACGADQSLTAPSEAP